MTEAIQHPDEHDEQIVENLRHLLHHPAWTDFYEPSLQEARRRLIDELLVDDPSARRSGDYLRARIHTLDTILSIGPEVVARYDEDQARKEQLQREAREYQVRAESGHMGPIS